MGRCWGSHPMAIPWNGIGASHGWITWNASMGSSWGSPNGALCVAHGDHRQWPFHGMAIVCDHHELHIEHHWVIPMSCP